MEKVYLNPLHWASQQALVEKRISNLTDLHPLRRIRQNLYENNFSASQLESEFSFKDSLNRNFIFLKSGYHMVGVSSTW